MSTVGDLDIEFTNNDGHRCSYPTCTCPTWGECSERDRSQWGPIRDKRGESRWFCPEHIRHYREKSITEKRLRETSASTSTQLLNRTISLSDKLVQDNVAAAQRGAGRAPVRPVGDFSHRGPVIETGSESYESHRKSSAKPSKRYPSGYDRKRHSKFNSELKRNSNRAASIDPASLKPKELVSLMVIVVVMLNDTRPKKAALVAKTVGDNCQEGTGYNIDAHIGGKALHKICYELIESRLQKWTCGYSIPMGKTTLRPADLYEPIAGYVCDTEKREVKEKDAIWDFFYTKRGKAKEASFKPRQLELHLCIEPDDYRKVTRRRESVQSSDIEVSD